ncbi:hypothetical protein B9Z55_027658 [Caenorhabditis nigoni]|uniref:Uncharacterized protein n=1 Tax=Caenorhabditis nigoni TaxID=1611254 RepID=A0A2G5SF84_9PELO|nr:hypothetical protein B9Z55_027658 [Caenorhabditis nigoni]
MPRNNVKFSNTAPKSDEGSQDALDAPNLKIKCVSSVSWVDLWDHRAFFLEIANYTNIEFRCFPCKNQSRPCKNQIADPL